ncbi:MAG: 4-demethylwyosine synthase TYW1 [Candidatus Micrarchaeia archaeon]
MVSEELAGILRRQKYRLFGNNAAAKLCLWTRRALLGKGVCYKQQFYGIASHRCLQLTPCVASCTQNCLFCWRVGEFAPAVAGEDEPEEIIEGALAAQRTMLSGYGGEARVEKKLLAEAARPAHAAISLAGEPTMYGRLPELVAGFHAMGMTTFVVSNGSNPRMIQEIEPTQLYVSAIAPDKQSFTALGRPMLPDAWERFNASLKVLSKKKGRTVMRLTLVKPHNLHSPEKWAALVRSASPMYMELKSYMHVGYSTLRLGAECQPSFEEVRSLGRELARETNYLYTSECKASKAVLLCRDEEAAEKRILKGGGVGDEQGKESAHETSGSSTRQTAGRVGEN